MRRTLRKIFLLVGVCGLVAWYLLYTRFLKNECAAAGIIPEECAFVLPWDLTLQQASMVLIVPGFVATIPFLLAFMLGGAPMTHSEASHKKSDENKKP